jgi:PAS domain S-box-containing protein
MQFVFPWYSLVYLAGTVIALILATVVKRRQFTPGTTQLSFFLYAMALWTGAYAFEISAVNIPDKFLFSKLQYVALVNTGPLALLFILKHIRSKLFSGKKALWLWIIPILTLALELTNDLHGLVWSHIYQSGNLTIYVPGHLNWLAPAYQYILYFFGIILLIRYMLRGPVIYRRQVLWFLAGSLIAVTGSVLSMIGILLPGRSDMTPLAICLMGIIFAVAILNFRILDILPVATSKFVNSLPEGFLLLDAEKRISSLNSAAEKIIGSMKADLQGQALSRVWRELDQVILDTHSSQHLELIKQKPEGRVYLDISVESFIGADQIVISKMVIIRDISEIKTIQTKLEAEGSNRSQFMRFIVHEIRNPLTAVISSIDMLRDQPELPEKLRSALINNVYRASNDLNQRVGELLDLARGELGILKIEPESLDMNQLIAEIGAEMQPIAAKNGTQIAWETPEPKSSVYGDKQRLRQVLANLILNAIKYTPNGEIIIRSRLQADNLCLVEVKDNGRGMNETELESLFNPGLGNSRERTSSSGLGIGLMLSKQYIELHKGRIWAESIFGQGTTLSFVIPVAPPVDHGITDRIEGDQKAERE